MKQRAVIFALIIIGFSVFFVPQNSGAQVDNVQDRNCQGGYDSARTACKNVVFTCYDSCDKYDPEYYACMDSCTARNRDCIAAANSQYSSCVETPDQPAPPESGAVSPSPADNQTVQVDLADIVKLESRVREEAKKIIEMKKCPDSLLPSENPCVAEKLDFILAEPRESYLTISPFERRGKNIEPIVLDRNEKRDITGLRDAFLHTPPMDLRAFNEQLEVREIDLTASEENFAKPPINAQRPFIRAAAGSTFSLALVENAVPGGGTAPIGLSFAPIDTQTEVSSPSIVVTGEKPAQFVHPNKTIINIAPHSVSIMQVALPPITTQSGGWRYTLVEGALRIDKSEDGKAVEVRTPLTITKSKHTQFAVLYNAEELYAATVVYEGEVEVTDVLNGLTTILTPAEDGKPRALVVPLAKTAGPLVKKSNLILIIIILLLLAGIGYLTYIKRDKLIKIIKKEPKQLP